MESHVNKVRLLMTLVIVLLAPPRSGQGQMDLPSYCQELYPDLCPIKSKLYDNYLWSNGGVNYLRLSNSIANVGYGQLYIEPSGPVNLQSGKRPARQRTWCVTIEDDTLYKYYPVDSLVYHGAPCHAHVHVGKIAKYSIRADTGLTHLPGAVLDSGSKVGFCLVDHATYQQDACCGPVQGGTPLTAFFAGCTANINSSFFEGISVGWFDDYDFFLADQWIQLSHVSLSGRYWLESVVDPDKFLKQFPTTNDTARIPIMIAFKDLYEPNDSKSAVDAMTRGGAYSSHLSTCQTTIDNLTIHREYPTNEECEEIMTSGDVDYFKIYLAKQGGQNHSIAIRFTDLSSTDVQDGNLDMELSNSNGVVALANDDDDDEVISLNGKPAGTYYIKVFGRGTADPVANINYYYRLELSLPSCGDVNADGVINLSDVLVLTACCQSPPPGCNSGNVPCYANADVDGDGVVNCIDRDLIYAYVFLGTSLPCP